MSEISLQEAGTSNSGAAGTHIHPGASRVDGSLEAFEPLGCQQDESQFLQELCQFGGYILFSVN